MVVTGFAAANAGPGASGGYARRPPCYPRLDTFSSMSTRHESVQGAAGRASPADKVDDMSGIAERRVSNTRCIAQDPETSVMTSAAAAATSMPMLSYNSWPGMLQYRCLQSADYGFRDSIEHCGTYWQNTVTALHHQVAQGAMPQSLAVLLA